MISIIVDRYTLAEKTDRTEIWRYIFPHKDTATLGTTNKRKMLKATLPIIDCGTARNVEVYIVHSVLLVPEYCIQGIM